MVVKHVAWGALTPPHIPQQPPLELTRADGSKVVFHGFRSPRIANATVNRSRVRLVNRRLVQLSNAAWAWLVGPANQRELLGTQGSRISFREAKAAGWV